MTPDRRLLEHISYQLIRLFVASFGALAFGAGAGELCEGIPRSEGPAPTLADRFPAAVAELAVGALCLVPFRWTFRGWAFRVRLVALGVAGGFTALRGVQAIGLGLAGGRDPLIFPVGLFFIVSGVGLPTALWWRRDLSRRSAESPPQGYDERSDRSG